MSIEPKSRLPLLTIFLLSLLLTASGQRSSEPSGANRSQVQSFSYVIDLSIQPIQNVALPGETIRRVASVLEPKGIREDFFVDEVVFHPRNASELREFLRTYHGRVLDDGTIPLLPPQYARDTLASSVTEKTGFVVIKVDSNLAQLGRLAANVKKLGVGGMFRYSSPAGVRLTAIIAEERLRGRKLGVNLLLEGQSTRRPCNVKTTYENPNSSVNPDFSLPNLGFIDGFTLPWLNDSEIRVTDAWAQLSRNARTNQKVLLFIIDAGFSLNADFGFPTLQYNIGNNTFDATGPNPRSCIGTPCPWHGTDVFSTAGALINNRFGAAGTGGQIVEPVLFRATGFGDEAKAVRMAISWSQQLGLPGVINMSFAGNCGLFCWAQGLDDAVANAARQGLIPIAGAGNKNEDVEEENVIPCRESGVICVGAIGLDKKRARSAASGFDSNYGSRVDIWAPGDGLATTPNPSTGNKLGNVGGTSMACPFVAGIVAMMKSINPSLSRNQVRDILRAGAVRSADPQVNPGFVNASESVRQAGVAPPVPSTRFQGTGAKWHDGFGFRNEVVSVGDFNGDCRDDIVAFTRGAAGNVFVALSIGSGFVGTGQQWGSSICVANQTCTTGDFNGDGNDDVAAFDQDAGTVLVALNLGTSFGAPSVWLSGFSSRPGQSVLVGNFGGARNGEFERQMDDIAVVVRGNDPSTLAPGETRGEVYVALSNGTSFTGRTLWDSFFAPGSEQVAVGDFDADGFSDLVVFLQDCCPGLAQGDVFVARSLKDSFGPSEKWNDSFNLGAEVPGVGDFDGDGRFDIVTFVRNAPTNSPGTVIIAPAKGLARFDPVETWHRSFCFGSEICGSGDFDGDGRSDIIAFTMGETGDVYVALSRP